MSANYQEKFWGISLALLIGIGGCVSAPAEVQPTPAPVPSALPTPFPAIIGPGLKPLSFAPVQPQLSSLAGSGESDYQAGSGPQAAFAYPWGVGLSPSGDIVIADRFNHRLRQLTLDGMVTLLAGQASPGFADGPLENALFDNPQALIGDSWGQLYISDPGNQRIRQIQAKQVITLAGTGKAGDQQGRATQAQLNTPLGLAIDGKGNLYFADANNHQIRKLSADGQTLITVAGSGKPGFKDGPALQAQFYSPRDLVFDSHGQLWITDGFNHALRKLTPSGEVLTVAGTGKPGFKDGTQAQFSEPEGLCIAADDQLYLADSGNHRIRKITPTGQVSTLAGNGLGKYQDGPALQASFSVPRDLAIIAPDQMVIVDTQNQRIRLLK